MKKTQSGFIFQEQHFLRVLPAVKHINNVNYGTIETVNKFVLALNEVTIDFWLV